MISANRIQHNRGLKRPDKFAEGQVSQKARKNISIDIDQPPRKGAYPTLVAIPTKTRAGTQRSFRTVVIDEVWLSPAGVLKTVELNKNQLRLS